MPKGLVVCCSFTASLDEAFERSKIAKVDLVTSLETHYLSIKENKADTQKFLDKRKRGLLRFLNGILSEPLIRAEHIVHRFFTPEVSWSEVLHSSMIALLPENCLYSSPFFNEISFKDNNENKPSKNVILAATNSHLSEVQIPTFLSTVKFPNLFWEESYVKSIKFSRVFREKVYRGFYKMVSKYSELTNAFSEFGAALNAFSLSEESTLSEAIECVGQCVDLSYNCYGIVVEKLSVEILEDYEYFDDTYSSLRQVLIYRNNKQIQFETVSDLLNIMQTELDSLLKLDADAHRLSIALSSDESTQDSSNLSNKNLLEYQKNNEELVHSIDNHLIKANKDSKDKHNEPFPAFAINKDTTIPKNQVHSLESNEAETYLNK
ncbi:Sorting nexin-41, partial [Smittium culicis]